MNSRICYIVGAGEFFGFDTIPDSTDFVIAADAGLKYLEAENIGANLAIGDFDTLCEVPNHPNVIKLSCEKDDTDTLAAIREGIKLGYDTFFLYGCTGGRVEHTLANIQTLKCLSKEGKRGFLFGKDSIMTTITNDKFDFLVHNSGYVSVFSLTNQAKGVFLKGLKYELTNATLTNDFPIGVSNEFAGTKSSIEVKDGTLLIVFPKECKEDI